MLTKLLEIPGVLWGTSISVEIGAESFESALTGDREGLNSLDSS
jgi:hypothetical protein